MPNGPGHVSMAFNSIGQELFMGMYNNGGYGGLWHSVDTGKTWTFKSLQSKSINCLRKVNTKMYAGLQGGGVWISSDTCTTWTATTLNTQNVSDVEISGNFIYAATDNGIYLSSDTGATWTAINTGLTSMYINSIFIDGGTLYASAWYNLFKSTNNGGNWVSTGFTNVPVAQVGRIGSLLFAATYNGMYSSTNNGNTWNNITTSPLNSFAECMYISGTKMYVGTHGGGMFTSINSGNTWQSANTGLTFPDKDIRTIYQYGNVMVCGGGQYHAGAYISEDGGQNWSQRCKGISDAIAYAMCTIGNTMFCADFGGVFKSTDNGITWVPTGDGLASDPANCVATDGSNLYRSGFYDVKRSTDLGQSWTTINTGLPSGMAGALLVSGTTVFVTKGDSGIYRSTNYGGNWTAVNTGLGNLQVGSFAQNSSYIFAGTAAGVYRSSNNGGNWTLASTGLPSAGIRAMTANNNVVIAGIYGQYVYRSTNNGTSWAIDTVGYNNPYVLGLTCQGQNIFSSNDFGMFLSMNNGLTWSSIQGNLGNRNVMSVYVNSANVYAGTWGWGVWSRPLSDFGICNVPAVQAANISFTNVTANSVTVNWWNGDGGRRIVKIKPANGFTAPVNGNDYSANAAYTGSGEQVVYNGTGNSVTVTGLSSSHWYWFRVYEASCTSTSSLYLMSAGTGNPRKVLTQPSQNPNRPEAGTVSNSLQVFPNPTSSFITIESSDDNPIQSLLVYGLDGRLIKALVVRHQPLLNIDMSDLSAGIYFLDCTMERGSEMVKVVKY
jgi:hypothetical protein